MILARDIWFVVFKYLDVQEMGRVQCTCKQLNQMGMQEVRAHKISNTTSMERKNELLDSLCATPLVC